MSTIWKEVLSKSQQEIELPIGSRILHVREQYEQICVWYICNPKHLKEKRIFTVIGTGHEGIGINWVYLGTASLQGGQLIFHVFEEKP